MIRLGDSGAAPCCLLAAALAGCLVDQRYLVPVEPITLRADAPPAFVDEDGDPVFRVEQQYDLHVTPPSAAELARLAAQPAPPYPRAPWVGLDDLALQLDYALTNASDAEQVVALTVDGRNEFHAYAPGLADLHQWSRRLALAPRARVTGSITELELEEVALDLATVVNGAPNSNLVVDPRSQARRDPRVAAYVPRAVPGLVRLLVGLESERAADLALTLTVRVEDHGGRGARRGARSWVLPEPAAFAPVVPEDD